jgi:hypothetical protein
MGFENFSQQSFQPMRALQDSGTSQKKVGIPTGFLSAKLYHFDIQRRRLKNACDIKI